LFWLDHDRGVEHDRRAAIGGDDHAHGPDSVLGQVQRVHLPGPVRQMGRCARDLGAGGGRIEQKPAAQADA
jgi:hypothetical protein